MRYLLYSLFWIFFLSCSSADKPTYKLTDDQLTRVLLDIHFADVTLTSLTRLQQDSVKRLYWNQMEEIYKMSEAEIREEIKKLESEPEKFKIIIGHVKAMADSIQ